MELHDEHGLGQVVSREQGIEGGNQREMQQENKEDWRDFLREVGVLRTGYMSLVMPLASMAHCHYAKAITTGTQLC